jgi:hypothetical protein
MISPPIVYSDPLATIDAIEFPPIRRGINPLMDLTRDSELPNLPCVR